MIGQRRALGVRVDSQRNINVLDGKQSNLKNALDEKQNVKNIPIKPASSLDEKKRASPKPTLKRYGGRQCMVSEETADHIDRYLKVLEKGRQIDTKFLDGAKIDGRMRGILLDWLLQIQAKFQLASETFYLTVSILDRIVVPLNVNRHNFQLIGLACIFIACKCEEVLIPNVLDFVYMAGDCCEPADLFKAEKDVLRAIEFKLNFTYPNHFLRKIRLLMPFDSHAIVYEVSKLLVDITVVDYSLAAWLPSEAAAASIHFAYNILQLPCSMELLESVGVSSLSIAEKSKLLASRLPVHLKKTSKLQGLRLKYKDTEILDIVDNYLTSMKTSN